MKRVLLIFLLIASTLFAKTCIIAYCAIKIPIFQKEKFQTIFKDKVIIKKQRKYEVLKLGPFNSINDSKTMLAKVKKDYKDAFIVNCQNNFNKKKKITQHNNSFMLTPCKINCKNFSCKKCKNKHYPWEINKTKIKNSIKLSIEPIVAFPKEINSYKKNNETNNTCIASFIRFYLNGNFTYMLGQQPASSDRFRGDYENTKVGLQYGCFAKNWKFYTDDRAILYRKHKNHTTNSSIDLDIKELYLQSYELFDNRLNFLIGRKQLFDARSWWIDKSMDVVGIFNLHDLYKYQIYMGGRLNNSTLFSDDTSLGTNLKHTKFLMAHFDDEWYYLNHISLFALKEKTDLYLDKKNMNWLGLRFFGDKYISEKDKIRYWIDMGIDNGEYNYQSKRGFAYDIGVLYKKDINYSFGLSYASGSKEYKQPIFADNKSNFLQNDVKFRYYGEFLDPELTNISILSIYAAYKPSIEKTYILSLHSYRQNSLSDILHTTSYIVPTNSMQKNIGQEIDFLYQYQLSLRYKYKIIFSYFKGGNAFNQVAKKKDGLYAKFNFTYYW